MLQTFCRVEDGYLIAHQWDEVNASLIAAWSNGGKGGRPKKPTGNPRVNPESNPVNPRLTHGVTDREDREDKTEKIQADKPPTSRFQKPTLDQLNTEAALIGLSAIEAEKFLNYYESNGWKVGKNPMKSWRAALRNWWSRVKEVPGLQVSQSGASKEVDWRLSV